MTSIRQLNIKSQIMFFFGVSLLILAAILLVSFPNNDSLENASFMAAGVGATFATTGITLNVEYDKQKKS